MLATTTTACSFEMGGMTPTEAFPGIDGQLVQAAVSGHTRKMEQLVEQGANPNAKGAQGSTPLIWAMAAHNHRGLEKLLELGADPNAPFPMRRAAVTATWIAARGNDFEALRILLEHGGDPNTAYECKTPLMAVIGAMDIRRIDLLLAHGADVNGEACNSSAPDIATDVGRFDLVLYLLDKGYNHNLDRLAWSATNSFVPEDSQAYQDKQRVLEILRQRGVTIPPQKQ